MNNIFRIAVALLSVLVVLSSYSQEERKRTRRSKKQNELVDTRIDNMGYWKQKAAEGLVPVTPYKRIPRAKYTGSVIIAESVMGGREDSPDVPVSDKDDVTASENSVFVSPWDNEVVLNSNNSTSWDDIIAETLFGANAYTSQDAGFTWGGTEQGAGGYNIGDPTTAISLDGSRMYVNYIDGDFGQGVSTSTDGGENWITAMVAPNPGYLADKNHMWIDNSVSSPYAGNLYVAYTAYNYTPEVDILFHRSTDDGNTWSGGLNISSEVMAFSHNQGVNIQTGPNGEVYACWAIYDGWPADECAIGFAKSTDGGATFEPSVRIIENIRGVRNTTVGKQMRVNSFPVMAVDISDGVYRGNIYIVWTNIGEPGINFGEDASVYMIRSTDEGATWSNPAKVNQDPANQGKKHYLPWITCDPQKGILSAVWYDDRNVGANQCETFCANSYDGGETWEDFKVSDVAFTISPIPGLAEDYMGDYLGISANGGLVYPVWTDTRGGKFMSYTSPYFTNTLPSPSNLSIDLNDENGETTLNWVFEPNDDLIHFIVYRDNIEIGTTADTSYTDMLPDYGLYKYSVAALLDEGESVKVSGNIQWGDAHIVADPEEILVVLPPDSATTRNIDINNTGELLLEWDINTEFTSDDGSRSYCAASGGIDEYIANVVFGDIDNPTGFSNYTDFTYLSTTVDISETYSLTIVGWNTWPDDDLGVWIDWNQDNDFFDDGENVVCAPECGGSGIFQITVPANAMVGETRMRIRLKNIGFDCGNPCGETTWGEVEDYTINVFGWLSITPLVGTVNAGNFQSIDANFNTAGMEEGTYTANVNIYNNDPDNELFQVPVTLIVGNLIVVQTTTADPDIICEGDSSELNVVAEGGTGNYSYTWTSDPPGFTSNEASPIVIPLETTTYYVEVSDGSITGNGQVEIIVNPSPDVLLNIIPAVGLNTTPFELTGGSPEGGVYSGAGVEDGLFNPELAGIGIHAIRYTYSNGTCENYAEANIEVEDDFGVNEYVNGSSLHIYPNPNKGEFNIELNTAKSQRINLKIFNNKGIEVYSEDNISIQNSWNKTMNLSHLTSGVYYVSFINEETYIVGKVLILAN
ncbi:MAG: GEVED domain-containing protein [Bacteroidota bacterium]